MGQEIITSKKGGDNMKKKNTTEKLLLKQNAQLYDLLTLQIGANARAPTRAQSFMEEALDFAETSGNIKKKRKKLTNKQLNALAKGRQILKSKRSNIMV